MNAAELSALCGLPLADARAIVEKNGLVCEITRYHSRKGALGPDERVLRARISGDAVELVVSSFLTDVTQE